MASLWQHPKTSNWIARFRGAAGKTVNRSTGITAKADALLIAKGWELEAARERDKQRQQADASISTSGISDVIARAERMARQGRLNAATAREIINELLIAAGQATIAAVTERGWCEAWLAGKAGTVAPVSLKAYQTRCKGWLRYLGRKADASLDTITKEDVIGFRNALVADKLWTDTINQTVMFLRNVHQAAVEQGHLGRNPFAGIDTLQARRDVTKAARREPFSIAEVGALLKAADNDWRGMVLLAATTGLRLMDAARLTWKTIHVEQGVIRVTTAKTGAELTLPTHPLFAEWLAVQPRGIANAPVFPALHRQQRGGTAGLCVQFRALMQAAGVVAEMAHTGKGKGRNKSKKSFHSLRHFAATQLASNGVRADIARAITGHSDAETHANYVTPDLDAMRGAVHAIRLSA
jgi:integrase